MMLFISMLLVSVAPNDDSFYHRHFRMKQFEDACPGIKKQLEGEKWDCVLEKCYMPESDGEPTCYQIPNSEEFIEDEPGT
jgi:hypothetical protein